MNNQNKKDHFLSPEVRCGFEVTVERKRLWKTQLEIVEILVEIFERHGIRYILDGGTLLGAARHGGFIPWDDDFDLTLLREDYDRLDEILPKELPPYLFFQTSATDHDYTITHVKIRDSRTSAIAPYHVEQGLRYNMGVFVDIFPVDGAAPTKGKRSRQMWLLRLIKTIHVLAARRRFRDVKERVASWSGRIACSLVGRKRLYRLRQKVEGLYPVEKEDLAYGGIAEWGYVPRFVRKKEWFTDVVYLPFEYLTLRCPRSYEDVLTSQYGDWHKWVKGTGLHGGVVFDLDKDYKTKLIEEYGYKPEDFTA